MSADQKKKTFIELGKSFARLADIASSQSGDDQYFEAMLRARSENSWFTLENQEIALRNWSKALEAEKVDRWFAEFEAVETVPKRIGLIMAGNIPMVGLHDLLCVLASGHKAMVKLSSKDRQLLPMVVSLIRDIDPLLAEMVEWRDEMLGEVEAIVATGTNNSARYFEYYFRTIPHIIRKNRNSLAILQNSDSEEDLERLANDIFDYFGQGCRNVSKIYIPKDFDVDRFFKGILHRSDVNTHHKYMNNYEYNKTVWLLSQYDLLENGFLVLKEDAGLRSPLGTMFYERYDELEGVLAKVAELHDEIQCVVGNIEQEGFVPFGRSQEPELWDYADGVNTMEFLTSLKKG